MPGPVIGTIPNPLENLGDVFGSQGTGGLILMINNTLRLVFIAAGMYAFINILIAGGKYMTAGGDAAQIEECWAKIWQSFVGLIIMIGAFAFAVLIGQLFFGDAGALLNPSIPTVQQQL